MERHLCLWISTLLVLSSVSAEDGSQYVAIAGTLTLRPPEGSSVPESIIVWKHNGNMVVEWNKGQAPEYFSTFRGRTTLNTNTGQLEIKNMGNADSGIYKVELNNKEQPGQYDVKVIKKVPRPKVEVGPLSCSSASSWCTLTCNGNHGTDTTDAEPITYSWKKGDQEWKMPNNTKEITINNTEEMKSVKTFSCRMKNPVSEEESEPQDNPFFQEQTPDSGLAVGIVVLVLALLAVVGGVGWWKRENIRQLISPRRHGQQSTGQSGGPGEESNPMNKTNETPNSG